MHANVFNDENVCILLSSAESGAGLLICCGLSAEGHSALTINAEEKGSLENDMIANDYKVYSQTDHRDHQ